MQDEPVFKYEVEKGIECITDKVSVHGDYVVMVPSWPLEARAIVMTLDINNKMVESGKYLVSSYSTDCRIQKQVKLYVSFVLLEKLNIMKLVICED